MIIKKKKKILESEITREKKTREVVAWFTYLLWMMVHGTTR